MQVLITGGAGFVGSHLAERLLREGHEVRALDNLDRQVHPDGQRPDYLNPDVELQIGDVRDHAAVARALDGVDAVYHFAAAVGVGQSMHEIERYTSVNTVGAAVVLEEIVRRRETIRKLVVASSMSIYGEGRENEPIAESYPLLPASVYAVTKRDQEDLFLAVGSAYEIPTVAFRFFNIYGERQALTNPYTGVVAIFAAALRQNIRPLIYEDGLQTRDFIDVRDIARACALALNSAGADMLALNLGTGKPTSILEVARTIAAGLDKHLEPEVTGQHRAGDIRHCYADAHLAKKLLGFTAEISFEDGMRDLLAWVETQ